MTVKSVIYSYSYLRMKMGKSSPFLNVKFHFEKEEDRISTTLTVPGSRTVISGHVLTCQALKNLGLTDQNLEELWALQDFITTKHCEFDS